MMLFLASIALGIGPMVLYAILIWRIDRWEREPIPLLLAAFLWGSIPSVLFALIGQAVLGIPMNDLSPDGALFRQLYQASFVAPLTEEITKGLGLLLLFLFFEREIDSVLDGLIYGSMIGFGFSAVENVLYFVGQTTPSELFLLFFLRAFVFGMLHALFTGLVGVGLALGKFSRNPTLRIAWPLIGLALAIFTHALHNFFATLGGEHLWYAVIGISFGLVWFGVTSVVCLWHENRWIQVHLAEEVENGVLFSEQAIDAAHFWKRSSLCILTDGYRITRQRHKLLHEATKLAFEKQRHTRFQVTEECLQRIARLRVSVKELSRLDPLFQDLKLSQRKPPPIPPPPIRRIR